MSTEMTLATISQDVLARVVESVVTRGDVSALSPIERARHYVQMCENLGLNPHSQPFAFLKLNGKEVMYATRGATDQLAAIHKVNREIIDGPKVIDILGTKVGYCVSRATHPNGRTEIATATVPAVDPVNLYMKLETKAKRRATLSILGLGMLDETELETIPANVKDVSTQVDVSLAKPQALPPGAPGDGNDVVLIHAREVRGNPPPPPHDEQRGEEEPREAAGEPVPVALEEFRARVAEIELPGESVAVWIKHRAELAPLAATDREAAWKALCAKTEEVGRMKNAAMWLKRCIAEEDTRRGNRTEPDADENQGSRVWAAYFDALPHAATCAEVTERYIALPQDLREEGCDSPEQYLVDSTEGPGALTLARQAYARLGHRLNKAESAETAKLIDLAKLLDEHVSVTTLDQAVTVWRSQRTAARALSATSADCVLHALARRLANSNDVAPMKAQVKALKEATSKADMADRGPGPGNGGGAPKPAASLESVAHSTATQARDGASTTALSPELARMSSHWRKKPWRGEDNGGAAVAGSYWAHFDADIVPLSYADRARAKALVIDELTRRGVALPQKFLDSIGVKNNAYQEAA